MTDNEIKVTRTDKNGRSIWFYAPQDAIGDLRQYGYITEDYVPGEYRLVVNVKYDFDVVLSLVEHWRPPWTSPPPKVTPVL